MGALTIVVTGAAGYLGRVVVAQAVARGHQVRAVVRRPTDVAGAQVCVADLVAGHDLGPVFAGADAVIHCAARLTGTEDEMRRDTLGGTAALATALPRRTRLVLVSSLAVYGAPGPGEVVTEDTPIEPAPALRDAYARTKITQEEAARGARLPLWIVRPGVIWGPGRLDNAHLGLRLGPLFLRIGGTGELPLAHVQNVALALVLAAETEPPDRLGVVNVVDDARPTRARWLRALGRESLPLWWRLPDMVAGALGARGRGVLRRPTLRARLMPLRYDNARAKAALDWTPVVGLEEGLALARKAAR
jgi:nucleoside-diphosphate-sugar epimerase